MKTCHISRLIAALALSAAVAAAAAISYDVNINTSALSGTSGRLDFTFGGGVPAPPPGKLTISNFLSDGSLGAPTLTNATGSLATQVVLQNTGFPPSDYLTEFTYGALLKFTFTFSGLAVDVPDGISGASTFAFSLLDNSDNPLLIPNPLPVDDPGGFAFTVDLDNTGKTTAKNFMNSGTISPAAPPGVVPEPNMIGVLMLCLSAVLLVSRWTRSGTPQP